MRVRAFALRLDPARGGGAHQSLDLRLRSLIDQGHDAAAVTVFPDDGTASDGGLPYRKTSIPLSTSRRALSSEFARLLRRLEREADVFHIDSPVLLDGAASYRALGGQVPVVARLNSFTYFCTNVGRMNGTCHETCGIATRLWHARSPLWKKAAGAPLALIDERKRRRRLQHVDAFEATSPFAADSHRRFGFAEPKFAVIPELIDTLRIRRRAGMRSKQFRIVASGRFVLEKGFDVLLDAAARLRLDMSLRVDLIGDGPEGPALRRRAEPLGDIVAFHGWVDESQWISLFGQADVFVLPARWPELLGRVVIEAMACGLPVIVPQYSGAAWAAGAAGRSFRNGDAEDLAHQILALYAEPEARFKLAQAARPRAEEFDFRRQVPKIIALYQAVTSGKAPGAAVR